MQKYILILFLNISLMIFIGCEKENNDITSPPSTTGKTITLDAKNDCNVLLDNATTIVTDLTPGQNYTVSVSSSNISGTPMKGAFFMYQSDDDNVNYRYVDNGGSFNFKPTNASRKIAPFIVDWSNISDNSGTVTINISGPTQKTITLDAKNDCNVLLDNATTIVTDLTPGQNYTVSVSSSNISGTPMKGAFFMYQSDDDNVNYRYVDNGGSFNFKPTNASRKIAPFIVDWSSISDNSGKINIEIK